VAGLERCEEMLEEALVADQRTAVYPPCRFPGGFIRHTVTMAFPSRFWALFVRHL
jgi:hypothetical protein